ncbi:MULTISPECIES: PqqD family protein [unclassified Yoonia]|uniref:PqqD family protein n=1 Tax=unclassified Yoonia TaxID=2629118 RepID=UPI002AFE42A7|nr:MULTISPECIES: PqqD family protein [unclassified Yoonia]
MIQRNAHPVPEAADSGPGSSRTVLTYPGVSVQIVLDHAAPVADALRSALHGWTPDQVASAGASAQVASVLGDKGTFAARSAYLGETIHGLGVAGAACAMIADLAQDYFVTRPGSLALHCAAFRFNNRLIGMTGPAKAGKSTLAARMTQEPDMTVFCDDVLPMQPDGTAVGLGISPRLRLPLPEACSDGFRAHVARHLGPSDDRYAYLCAPNVAPHGTKAPLSVLLILDRRPDGGAALHDVTDHEALHFLLSQNMADLETADAAIARLTDLLSQIICLRLVYSDLEDAVALIRQAFGGSAAVHADVAVLPPVPPAAARSMPAAQMAPDLCWARRPDVMMQATGDAAFLWLPGRQTVWRMNALALAVWTMLEIPGSAQDLAGVLADHFTDQDPDTLTADVNALLQGLAKAALIETADPMALSG